MAGSYVKFIISRFYDVNLAEFTDDARIKRHKTPVTSQSALAMLIQINQKPNIVIMQSRREFIQRFTSALGLLTVQPTTLLEAAVPTATSPVAAIPPIKEISAALCELSMKVGFLHTGAHSGKKATLAAVDDVMKQHKKFWDTALHLGLDKYTPEQMAVAMIEDVSANDPDLFNGDLSPEMAGDPTMVEFANQQRESTLRFHASILKQGMESAGKTEAELLDDAMERAADGYAHWKKINPDTWQEYERRVEMGEDVSKPYDKSNKPSESAPAELPLPKDATPHEKLEALLASTDVSVTKQGKELQLLSFDEGLIRQAAQIMQQDNMGSKVRAGKLSIVVEEPNHTLLSLARPYIQEYRNSKEVASAGR